MIASHSPTNVNLPHTNLRCRESKTEYQVHETSPRAPTNVAREEFKKALLAKAAIAREKNPKGKEQGEKGIEGIKEGQERCGLGKGHGRGTLASSSTAERDAIMRLLAS